MKLLTLNCHSWQEEDQVEKIKYLAKTIHEKNYDLIALQEVSQSIKSEYVDSRLKKDNFALLLKKELDKYEKDKYDFYWDFSHIGYDVYEEGLAIFTKHKIIESNSFFITESENILYWKSRKMIEVKIYYNKKELNFYSCHLGWWNDEDEPFKNQVDNLLKYINKDSISILLGDFNNNAFIENEGYDYLMKCNLIDTFSLAKDKDSGITVKGKIAGWEENEEKLRLDLILINQNISVESSKVIFNGSNKHIISDH